MRSIWNKKSKLCDTESERGATGRVPSMGGLELSAPIKPAESDLR